ncbi:MULTISPECIES: alpha-D-glucose phosphate-specific phosphoglucomutase [Roseobacteraceae]|jgi:phosphoglucomutase|uniref:phosphoglucomutase (alpha-D-glucose-1,6-bisphosphate-dependent) n=1 Tax=Pseudosulfitobacter pseudonitzschiae TaxID=1402135 RepID=A0A221K0J5_9RHOB|nr:MULTISPECIES: alpha-D-glucose phosphate-specific phosphoglucomutase [Roseobacteraceae]ASM72347.1 phosphoglucomutase [Pseudosulfitobacter pseudonitzschiae]
MTVKTISTTAFNDQKPGTSGLRKKTRAFMMANYLENYVAATFTAIDGGAGKTFVLGGDGRFFNRDAIQTILKMAAALGAARMIVGQGGLLSTPAASHLIRRHKAHGGFILSASHNPGGIDADFGLKFNAANGGPAPEALTARIHAATLTIERYDIADVPDINLDTVGQTQMGDMVIDVVDPVADYSDLMASLFDFAAIRALFTGGFTMRFDAMHAVTGPYAHAILEDTLGAAKGTVVNGIPLEDFGKGHPDPNPIWASDLMALMMSDAAPDMGAASDGDGDRNMIVGKGTYITPSDSLAMLAANAHLAPAYRDGITGIARSMPTSAAADRVADALGVPCFETPTGWKFFGTLLDAGRVTICGEESAGTGSHHVREKDGLWAVLLWLNILAARGMSVAEVQADHWQRFGRNYYARHDYEAVETARADKMMAHLRAQLDGLPGQSHAGLTVTKADDFAYTDPVDGSTSAAQGIRLFFEGGARAVFRLSGTGTEGATIRLYLEQFVSEGNHAAAVDQMLDAVRQAALTISDLPAFTGRDAPDVQT